MNKLGTLVVTAVGLAGPACASELPLAQRQRIDAVFAEYNKHGSPGCAMALLDHGRIAYQKGYGLANIEHGVPIDPQTTVFDIGSTSKQFTAASILLLAQDGKLALDDDIHKFIPELPDYGHRVTLDHLLRHTSSIPDYIALMMLGGINVEDHTTDDDALRAIARAPMLGFVPGSEYSYSNSGYFLLSLVVKRASGKPLREFASERIFKPLGMAHTRILDDHAAVIAHKAASYEAAGEGGYAASMSGWEQTGDGAVQTTLGDLARWDENFYAGKVGGAALLAQLQAPGVLNDGKPITYARGLMVDDYRGVKRISHGGVWAGFRAELARFPEQHVSVLTLCNFGKVNVDGLVSQVADIHLGKALAPVAASVAGKPASASVAARDVTPLAGLYVDSANGQVLNLVAEDGKLLAVSSRGGKTELVPVADGRFDLSGTLLTFAETTGKGAPMHVTLDMAGKPVRLERKAPATPAPGMLSGYAGRYYSRELDTYWTLRVDGGRLVLRPLRGADIPLVPVYADAFRGQGRLIMFQRDGRQQVTGFDLALSRVRGIRFARSDAARTSDQN